MFYYEIELNRKWLYDDDEDVIGEQNFVVSAEYFYGLMEMFGMDDIDASNFLDWYDPETDGELIYEFAVRDDTIIEEGDHYYSLPNLHI